MFIYIISIYSYLSILYKAIFVNIVYLYITSHILHLYCSIMSYDTEKVRMIVVGKTDCPDTSMNTRVTKQTYYRWRRGYGGRVLHFRPLFTVIARSVNDEAIWVVVIR